MINVKLYIWGFILCFDVIISTGQRCSGPNFTNHRNFYLMPGYPECGRGYLQPGVRVKSRILGGEQAVLGEFPWMARLTSYFSTEEAVCGGSLISKRYVISAGHCVYRDIDDKTRRVQVILGDFNIDTNPDCDGSRCGPRTITTYVTHLYLHAYLSNERGFYTKDIGLLRLKHVATFSDYVRPICLPFECPLWNTSLIGLNMTLAGWGLKSENVTSKMLLKLSSDTLDWRTCSLSWLPHSLPLNPTVHQCFRVSTTQNTCSGDSGGPVMLETRISTKCKCARKGKEFPLGPTHYVYYLIAIVSYGPTCFDFAYWKPPALQTKVFPFLKWVLDRIKE